MVDYCIFLFFPFDVQFGDELITTIDWDQTVEDVVVDILNVKNDEFYLFIDEAGDMNTGLRGIYKIVNACIETKKKVILATTSGWRWFSSKNDYFLVDGCLSALIEFTILPFTIDEAKDYFGDTIDLNFFADIVNHAELSPIMLRSFRAVKSEKDFQKSHSIMETHWRNLLADMTIAKRDDLNGYHYAIELSLKWLIRALSKSVVYSSELNEYFESYVACEYFTFTVNDLNLAKEMELPIKSFKGTSEAKEEMSGQQQTK